MRERFVETWKAWDAHPSHTTQAWAMVDVCIELSGMLGIPMTELRQHLGPCRQSGMSYEEAYDWVVENL